MVSLIKRNVIIVTDGDLCAKNAVEIATCNIGGRCISASAGNPTEISGEVILNLIKIAKNDPVVIMVDDKGDIHNGFGEIVMEYILNCSEVNVLGVVAVASNTKNVKCIKVDCSVDRHGLIIDNAVTKDGYEKHNKKIIGDTLGVLNYKAVPIIVGVGDIGKFEEFNYGNIGASIITIALQKILEYNNYKKQNG